MKKINLNLVYSQATLWQYFRRWELKHQLTQFAPGHEECESNAQRFVEAYNKYYGTHSNARPPFTRESWRSKPNDLLSTGLQ